MRIGLFKVSKESSIGEFLHAGRVVGHDVEGAREVASLVKVPMLALVGALHVAQVRGGGGAGDGAFGHPGDRWSVVGTARDCRVPHVVIVGHEHDLPEEASVLQVAVGDDPFPAGPAPRAETVSNSPTVGNP